MTPNSVSFFGVFDQVSSKTQAAGLMPDSVGCSV